MYLDYIETCKHVFRANERRHVPHKARSVEVCIILGEENWTNIFKYCSFSPLPDYFLGDLIPKACEKCKHLALTLREMRIHWKLQPKQEEKMLIFPVSCFFLYKVFLLEMSYATQHPHPSQVVLSFCILHRHSVDISGYGSLQGTPTFALFSLSII